MPAKAQWLLRVPEILAELAALDVPVLDRAVCERLFRLRRRRTIDLIRCFGGYQAGRTFLVDRPKLGGHFWLIGPSWSRSWNRSAIVPISRGGGGERSAWRNGWMPSAACKPVRRVAIAVEPEI